MADTTEALAPDGPKRLATQQDMAAVTGKTLMLKASQKVVIAPDGSLSGQWDGKPLAGVYEMRDGYFCRVLTKGPNGPAPEDCQLLILDGTSLNVTRDKGKGASFTYQVS